MSESVSATFTRLIIAWVSAVARRAAMVLAATILVTATLFYYTATNLTVNTDTTEMISNELPFRRVYKDYKRLFPQYVDNLLVVVEADVPEVAESTAATLAKRMESNTELFNYVFAPASEPHFATNGFLYLEAEELSEVIDRLAGVEPLLANLSEDPSSRGLFEVLGLAIDDLIDGEAVPDGLFDAFDRIAETVEAQLAGQTRFLSWQSLMAGERQTMVATRYFITAQPRMDFSSLQPARAALRDIRRLADQLENETEGAVSIRITGPAAIKTEELTSVTKGAATAGMISLILVAFLLISGLRSLKLVASALITLIVGLIWTASFATMAIGFLNLISVAFAVLFIGLGIDFGIHFCLRYKEEIDRGLDNPAALGETAGGVGIALALCAPTTALAFYAFIPTDYAGLAQLGLISGTGMFIALFTSLTVLPALLSLMPLRRARDKGPIRNLSAAPFIRRHGKPISAIALGLGLVLLLLVPSARFAADPMKLRDPGTESVQALLALFEDPDTTPYTLQVLVPPGGDVAGLAARLEALAEVDRAITLGDLVPADQEQKLGMIDDAAMFLGPVFGDRAPVAPPAAAERRQASSEFEARLDQLVDAGPAPEALASAKALRDTMARFNSAHGGDDDAHAALEHALVRFLPYQLDKLGTLLEADFVEAGNLPVKLGDSYLAADGTRRIEVFPAADARDQANLKRFVRAVQDIAPDVTGNPVQIVESGDIVIGAMRQALLWAGFLIAGLLLLVLRRVRDVILVLVPLALAGVYTVAATVVLGMAFNFANVIVLPLLIGMGVDGGIHLVMRAREDVARETLLTTSTRRAVLLSALTTIGSFGSLATSTHLGTASMGELLMIAITITMFCMLVVLPALMTWFEPGRPEAGADGA